MGKVVGVLLHGISKNSLLGGRDQVQRLGHEIRDSFGNVVVVRFVNFEEERLDLGSLISCEVGRSKVGKLEVDVFPQRGTVGTELLAGCFSPVWLGYGIIGSCLSSGRKLNNIILSLKTTLQSLLKRQSSHKHYCTVSRFWQS